MDSLTLEMRKRDKRTNDIGSSSSENDFLISKYCATLERSLYIRAAGSGSSRGASICMMIEGDRYLDGAMLV